MPVPPVFDVDELTPELIEDLKQASNSYLDFGYTRAFDALFEVPEWSMVRNQFLSGQISADKFLGHIRELLLAPWHSARTVNESTMPAISLALANIRDAVAKFPQDLHLDQTESSQLKEMVRIFEVVDDCAGVGPTIASKLLAPLRPALFPMWDNDIAKAYGFAANAAGYHQFLRKTRSIAKKVRQFWRLQSNLPFEGSFGPRRWKPPLIKILDEWNWTRIIQGISAYFPKPRGIRPGKQPVKNQLRELLRDIDAGRVTVRKLNTGAAVHVNFATSNGWKICVFNDFGCFDYIESAVDPRGNDLDYEDMYDPADRIDDPKNADSWGILEYFDIDPAFPDEKGGPT